MSVWFVSRHKGAIEWMAMQGYVIDYWVEHLDVDQVQPGDIVLGTLPVHLAAEICLRGAKFWFLVVEQQRSQRGSELSAADLLSVNCQLRPYEVTALPVEHLPLKRQSAE